MSKEKLIPKMRFESFIDKTAWIQNQLKNMSQSYSGGTPSVGNSQFYNGNIPFIRSGEIYKDTTKLFITEEAMNNSSARMVHKGDILYALYGATSGEVSISKIDGAINQAILAIIPDKKYDTKFLEKYLNKEKEYILNSFLQGGQGNLSGEIIRSLNIIHPSFEEQQKIGIFFEKIDKMIQLQQSKVNKVKDIKSAYLSEMFPKKGEKYPKKRFEGFVEPWVTRKLGSLLNYEQPTKYLVESDTYDDSYATPVLTAGKSFLLGYTNESEGIYEADQDNGVIIFDDFTTSSHYVRFNFKVKSSAMKFLRATQSNLNLYFLYNLLNNINYSVKSHERHWISIFSKFEVLIPEEREQNKIAEFFENLDNQILIEEEKLAKLEKLKQAYLNDMFV